MAFKSYRQESKLDWGTSDLVGGGTISTDKSSWVRCSESQMLLSTWPRIFCSYSKNCKNQKIYAHTIKLSPSRLSAV